MNMDMEGDDQPGCFYNKSVEFFYNNSGKNISKFWRRRDYVVVSLGMMVCIIVILANILVMTAIFINRRFHFPIYYLLGNLAFADLFAGSSYLFLMFHTGPWTIRLTQYRWFIRQVSVCVGGWARNKHSRSPVRRSSFSELPRSFSG